MDTVALHNVTVVVLLLVVNIVLCCTLYGNTDPRPSGKSLLCSWWWWTVHYAGSEPVPIAFEFLANLPFGGEEKSFAERIGRFWVCCHTACCRTQQSEDLKPGCPNLVTGPLSPKVYGVRSLTIQCHELEHLLRYVSLLFQEKLRMVILGICVMKT